METKKQVIIPCKEGAKNISSIALSPSKRYLAIGERSSDLGLIKIIDLKFGAFRLDTTPKKVLFHLELPNCYYICLSFFPKDEHKYICGLTNTCNLIVFEWDKGKVKHLYQMNCSLKPNGMFFNPYEKEIIVIYGSTTNNTPCIKSVQSKLENGNLSLNIKHDLFKDFVKNYSHNILCHVVLRDSHFNIMFGTYDGELLLINKQYELKLKLICGSQNDFQIEQILATNNGFAIAGSSSTILFYQKNNKDLKNPYYQTENRIELHNYVFNTINNFISLNDHFYLIGLSSGELLQATLLTNKNGIGSHFKVEPCLMQFHTNKINDMKVCNKKSILITCSSDKTIIVFNYVGKI